MGAQRGWPFIGRDHITQFLLDRYRDADCGGVVLEGAAGVGKTRLADEFATAATNARTNDVPRVIRLVGSSATSTLPYAALAHVVSSSVDGVQQSTPDAHHYLAALGADTGMRTIIIADDIAHLDDASLLLLALAAGDKRAFVVGTLRSGAAQSSTLDTMRRSARMAAFEVPALDERDTLAAVETFLGAPLDPRSADRINELCAGNPLYLRELILHAQADGSLQRWPSGLYWLDPQSIPTQLLSLVGHRIGTHTDHHQSLPGLLAIANEATFDDLSRLGLLDEAADCERRGLVRVDRDGNELVARLAHPLHGEAIRASIGAFDERRLLQRAVHMVGGRPSPRVGDELRVAVWKLEAAEQPDVDVLLAGARQALAAGDLASALRLAGAVETIAPSIHSQQIVMTGLFNAGRLAECIAAGLRELPADVDIATLINNTSVLLYAVFWGTGDAAQAEALISRRRPLFEAMGLGVFADYFLAFVLANDGRTTAAAELLGPSPDNAMLQFLSAISRATTWTWRGRADDASAEIDRAFDFLAALPNSRETMGPQFFWIVQGVARAAQGRFDDALHQFALAHSDAAGDRLEMPRCFAPLFAGHSELDRGHLLDAEHWFLEASAVAASLELVAAQRVAIAGLVSVAAQRNDRPVAKRLLAELDAIPDDLLFLQHEVVIGRAWGRWVVGDHAVARDSLRVAVDDAVGREEWHAAWHLLVEASRLGDARWASGRGADVVECQGALHKAWRSFVLSGAGRSAAPYAEAVAIADGAGTLLLAAEAAARHAEALVREGDARAARRITAAARQRAAVCQGAATPLLSVSTVVVVSAREREIGQLAVQGLTATEIAGRLVLSPRTVENHLQRLYGKLGVSSRAELADLL